MVKNHVYHIAPHHSHYFQAVTSITLGHYHFLQVFVFSVNGSSTDGHVHTFKGITSTNGHLHRVMGKTGPAIPTPDGYHYHEVLGETDNRPFLHLGNLQTPVSYPVHHHQYRGTTSIGYGYVPGWW